MSFYNEKLLKYNILQKCNNDIGWDFWKCLDFDHFFEREGYLNYQIHEENLDVLLIDHEVLDITSIDQKLNQLISSSKTVLILHGLQSARGLSKFAIPTSWPKRTYFLVHQNIDINTAGLSSNIKPIFYDFVYHEYRSWWFRTPYKSENYYGAAFPYDDRFFKISKIITTPREKIGICVGRTRPDSIRVDLEQLFTANPNWLCYTAFKSYDAIHTVNPSDLNHLFGMRDDPINNISFDPITLTFQNYKQEYFTNPEQIQLDFGNVWSQSNLIHNSYYQNSYISIYGESIEDNGIYVTEKTYSPLINGHFILPFGSSGFIDYLKKRGFVFPDFIDYSYDSLINKDQRKQYYLNEVTRLMNLPIDEWHSLYVKNIDLIHYNRKKMWEDPYPNLGIL